MRNEDRNMDEILREKLNDHSVEPPAHIWDGVQDEMAAIRKKRRMAYYSRIAAAAVVLLAFLAGWYFNDTTEEKIPESAYNESGKKESIVSESPEEDSDKVQEPATEQQKKSNTVRKEEDIPAHFSKNELLAGASSVPDNEKKGDSVTSFSERFSLERIGNIQASVSAKNISEKLKKKQNRQNEVVLTLPERNLIAENSVSFTNEEKSGKWKMGINVSPGYSSQTSSYSGSYMRNMTYQSSEGDANLSGGLAVQYKTGQRWSVESGIYYSQNGQRSGNSRNLFAFAGNSEADYLSPQNISERAFFNTAVQVKDNQMAMNSAAGVIEFEQVPKGALLAATPEGSTAYENTLLTGGEFHQVFDFVQIPFYLRYLVLDSKIDLEVLGGVSAGLLVGNNVFMENQYGLQNIGQTKDITNLNMAGTLGVGLNYALGKQISLAVEPRINYFLNSINSNPDVDYRPYRVGVYTGLFYEF